MMNNDLAIPSSAPLDVRRLRVPRVVRLMAPGFAAMLLGAMLLITIYFTLFDWEWVAFLAGVLFSALIALASRASQAEWTIARRTAQLTQSKGLLAQETAARKRAEHACRASEEKLRLFSDAMPSMLVYVDAGRRYRFHNRNFREWLGLSEAQIDGHLIGDVLGAAVYAEIEEKVLTALSGRNVDYERSQTMVNGALYRLRIAYVPHLDEFGKAVGFFALLTDISEREHLPISRAALKVESAGAHDVTSLEPPANPAAAWSDPAARLRQAIVDDEFRLYCQKIVPVAPCVQPQACYEILIRLQEEEDNLMPPGTFIPLVEQFNMTTELDHWVVRKVVDWHCRNRRNTPYWKNSMYCINLFASTLRDIGFAGFVRNLLAESGVPPHVLCFEIGEIDAVQQLAAATGFIAGMRRIGCRVALGSFGGGKTSLDALKLLPVNFLKIDGSLVRDMESDPTSLTKIKTVARVCKVIGIRTIAQFVESRELMEKFAGLEIDYAQGFGIAKPQPIDEMR